jgi:hypothetical protein
MVRPRRVMIQMDHDDWTHHMTQFSPHLQMHYVQGKAASLERGVLSYDTKDRLDRRRLEMKVHSLLIASAITTALALPAMAQQLTILTLLR